MTTTTNHWSDGITNDDAESKRLACNAYVREMVRSGVCDESIFETYAADHGIDIEIMDLVIEELVAEEWIYEAKSKDGRAVLSSIKGYPLPR